MKKIFLVLALLLSVGLNAQSIAGSIDVWTNSYTKVQFPKNNLVQLLGKLTGLNMNSASDQTIALTGGTKFIVTDVVITNASIPLTTAADFEIWTGTSRSILQIVAQGINGDLGLSNSSQYINSSPQAGILTLLNINMSNTTVGNTLYASLGTPQGAAATADIYVFGYILN